MRKFAARWWRDGDPDWERRRRLRAEQEWDAKRLLTRTVLPPHFVGWNDEAQMFDWAISHSNPFFRAAVFMSYV